MSNSKPILAYHDLRGICFPIKLLLAYHDIDYEDKRYPLTQDGLAEWGAEKDSLGLDFPNLPYYKNGSTHLTESRAILKYIAREEVGGVLVPQNPEDLAQAEMVESVLWDVWFFLIWRCYHDNEAFIAMLDRSKPKFDMLNKFLGQKRWVMGKEITYVDFMLYEILYHYSLYDPEYLKPYSGLLKLKANFEEIPNIKKFMQSPEYIKGPCYHPMFMKHKVQGLTC